MDRFHKKVLQKNHTQLVSDLDLRHSRVLDKLREDGMISSNEEDVILAEKSKRNQNTKLLNYLKKRDPELEPYDRFKRALGDEYKFIVDRLNKSESDLRQTLQESESSAQTCVHCTLSKNLMPPDVTHSLYENGILTDDDLDDLNNDNLPRQDRVKRLLELLKGKSDERETITQFTKSLETKYKYLVKTKSNHGLRTFLECRCKDLNDNFKGAKHNVRSEHANGEAACLHQKQAVFISEATANNDSSKTRYTNTYVNNNILGTTGHTGEHVVCQNCLSNSCALQGLCFENNLSKPSGVSSRTSEERSWVGNENSASIAQELSSDTDNTAVPDKQIVNASSTRLRSENQSNVKMQNLVPVLTASMPTSPSRESLLSIEDNTRVSGENGFQSQLNHSESACENSWVDTGQSDISDAENVCSGKCEPFRTHADEILKDISNIKEYTKQEGKNEQVVNTIFEVTPGFSIHVTSSDLLPLFTLNGRPPLNRLTSSDSTCGVPIPLGFRPINNREEFEHSHDKVKKKVKRKRYRHSSSSYHHEGHFDEIDGDVKPSKDASDEKDKDEKHMKPKEAADCVDNGAEEGAVGDDTDCQILQPVFKALPNNKKLMKRCSRLWDQLFFLREKGDWDTFSVVTMKAFDKFTDCPDIQVLLYRSEMCVSTFYKNDQKKALEMFDKAIEQLPKTEMPNWHLARILPLKVELCTRSKMFEEASGLLEDAKQAMMSLGPCLSTGAVYFFEAIYLGNILQCTRNDTKSAEGITEQVKTCFLTAIEHYQQEETFAIQSFLNQVYLFLALFSLGVDFKKIKYLRDQDIKREDISLAEHYLNLFENNCWENSTNWSRMLFYIGRGEQHKQMHNLERSLDYFKQAKEYSDSGKFGEHIAFIQDNIEVVSEKVEEQMRVQALRQNMSADDILKKVLETSSSESGSSNDN